MIGRIEGGKHHKAYRNLGSRTVQALAARIVGKPDHIALSSYRGMSRRSSTSRLRRWKALKST